jgi:hypothetical protein
MSENGRRKLSARKGQSERLAVPSPPLTTKEIDSRGETGRTALFAGDSPAVMNSDFGPEISDFPDDFVPALRIATMPMFIWWQKVPEARVSPVARISYSRTAVENIVSTAAFAPGVDIENQSAGGRCPGAPKARDCRTIRRC